MRGLLPVVDPKITATVDSFFIPNKSNGGTDPSKYKDQAVVLENVGYCIDTPRKSRETNGMIRREQSTQPASTTTKSTT